MRTLAEVKTEKKISTLKEYRRGYRRKILLLVSRGDEAEKRHLGKDGGGRVQNELGIPVERIQVVKS